jgi:hypothetical protein
VGVEGVEKRKKVRRDGCPSGFEEQGPKAIRARAGVGMHVEKCKVNFITIKG